MTRRFSFNEELRDLSKSENPFHHNCPTLWQELFLKERAPTKELTISIDWKKVLKMYSYRIGEEILNKINPLPSDTPDQPHDFQKEVADVHRGLKKSVEGMPERTAEKHEGIDRQVREQVISDLDGLIKDNESKKPWPGKI